VDTVARFLRRDPAEVEPWDETCGQIRPLIEEADGAAAEVHRVEIDHARLHYHEKTDEVYYVIEGEGTMAVFTQPGWAEFTLIGVSRSSWVRWTVKAFSAVFDASRLPMTTAMPSSPSPRAVSRPSPLFAPVMNATLS